MATLHTGLCNIQFLCISLLPYFVTIKEPLQAQLTSLFRRVSCSLWEQCLYVLFFFFFFILFLFLFFFVEQVFVVESFLWRWWSQCMFVLHLGRVCCWWLVFVLSLTSKELCYGSNHKLELVFSLQQYNFTLPLLPPLSLPFLLSFLPFPSLSLSPPLFSLATHS